MTPSRGPRCRWSNGSGRAGPHVNGRTGPIRAVVCGEVVTGRTLTAAELALGAATVSARHDYEVGDRLSSRTQALMWPAYAAGAAVIAGNLRIASITRTAFSRPGRVVVAAGAAVFIAASSRFGSFRQLAGRETGELVTGGIYRYTRHPQYVANILLAAGSAIAARSLAGGIYAASVAAAYAAYVPAEEAHLERVFGSRYADYRRDTPRWLGAASR